MRKKITMFNSKNPLIRIAFVVIMMVPTVICGNALAQRYASASDTRQQLILPASERDKVLAEMRVMLGSVSRILQALAADDIAAVEDAARASGIAMAADVDPHIKKRLPQTFLDLGMKTHKGFDELADRVKTGGTREDVIRNLASLTSNCVACHAIYRLDEAR